jgi:inositol-pentakisphosphate 2-kinase
LLSKILMKEPILLSLKKVQQMDSLDIEAIYYIWTKIHSLDGLDSIKFKGFEELNNFSMEEMELRINQFLIAASSKDCSLMITLFPSNNQDNNQFNYPIISIDNCSYRYRTAIIDLDEKIEENIPYYYQLDQTIATNYSEQEIYKQCAI